MKKLSGKPSRIVGHALDHLFIKKKSWIDVQGPDDLKKYDFLERKVDLSDHRVVLLTDEGYGHFRTIVATISEEDLFESRVTFSDIWNAVHDVFGSCLSNNQRPSGADDLLEEVEALLKPQIRERTHAIAVCGVQFKDGLEEMQLGRYHLRSNTLIQQTFAELSDEQGLHKEALAKMGAEYLWMVGTTIGTDSVANEQFRAGANLTLGMLGIACASRLKWGGCYLGFGLATSPHNAYGYSAWFAWDQEKAFHLHRTFVTRLLPITAENVRQITEEPYWPKALQIAQNSPSNAIESALVNATYWFSDAQRDQDNVMQFVKFWSCIEAFFSTDPSKVTQNLTAGLACLLTFGDYRVRQPAEYVATKQKIAELYDLRSRALHRAAHDHVSDRDVATVSTWAAWLAINMIRLVQGGCSTLEHVAREIVRLDKEYDP